MCLGYDVPSLKVLRGATCPATSIACDDRPGDTRVALVCAASLAWVAWDDLVAGGTANHLRPAIEFEVALDAA